MAYTQRRPELRYIMAGTYDDPNWIQLKMQIYMRSAQRWVVMPDHLERYEKGTMHGPPLS